MIKAPLTPPQYSTGNQAQTKKTLMGALAMTYDPKAVPKLLETLTAEDRERIQPAVDAVKNAIGQAQEQLAIKKIACRIGL